MIEFLSLFLGLTAGLHPVEMTVSETAAQVELRLDEERVLTLTAPPWRGNVDFGEDLRPRELVAVAYDVQGEELGRASQRINLPRLPAELRLVLESGKDGIPSGVRLAWESLSGRPPQRLTVQLDGRPLTVDQEQRAVFPPVAVEQLHFLSAEAEFAGHDLARSELTFGGAYGAQVQTDLTALVITSDSRREPQLDALQGRFRRDGKILRVVAIEHGPADVLVVRDASSDLLLARLRTEGQKVKLPGGRRQARPTTRIDPEHMRFEMKLEAEDRIRFLWPLAERVPHPRFPLEVFATSPPLYAEHGGMHWLLTRLIPPWMEEASATSVGTSSSSAREPEAEASKSGEVRLADAVAVAGLRASAANRRRAVALVLGSGTVDRSTYQPAVVRRYLATLGVPLHVWAERSEKRDAAASGWGDAQRIHNVGALEQAVRRLRRGLDRQWVVWVEGDHLARQIAADLPEGMELLR